MGFLIGIACLPFRQRSDQIYLKLGIAGVTLSRDKNHTYSVTGTPLSLALGQTGNMDFYGLCWSLIRHTTPPELSYTTFLPARGLLDCSCTQNGRSMSCKLLLVFKGHCAITPLPLSAHFLRHILLCCLFMETVSHSWLRHQDQADSCESYLV